jgi:hypothetical protein
MGRKKKKRKKRLPISRNKKIVSCKMEVEFYPEKFHTYAYVDLIVRLFSPLDLVFDFAICAEQACFLFIPYPELH